MAQISRPLSAVQPSKAAEPTKPIIPPLFNGDHLTRAEFERRFDAMPDLKLAELIEGKVYMSPPISHAGHSGPHVDLLVLFGNYRAATPGVDSGSNSSIRLDLDNMPQPDAYLFVAPAAGGQATIDTKGYIVGSPELVAEIAATTAAYDLHEKLVVYRRNGVKEYIVVRTLEGELDYFIQRDGDFRRLTPGPDGVFRSEVFPGLWIDAPALLRRDLATALRQLQLGLASPEHQNFVNLLQSKLQPKSEKS